jgi:D-beta-D-heptose 7-phosphate kinase / D-beta-D-heptose 1-phosphate adenosyltransferase
MEALKTLIRRVNKYRPKIAVVGDCLVDQYYSIVADKLSPEFPIVRMLGTEENPTIAVPGGAGNLANQFKHFNTDVKLFGFLDIDSQPLYQSTGVDISGCEIIPSPAYIPRKRRFYQDNFPLCRWDIEVPNYGLKNAIDYQMDLLESYNKDEFSVTIYADYNKGVFAGNKTQWFEKERDTISIVDPKAGPVHIWNGCTIFKPNAKEAQELSGIPSAYWQNQCDFFQRQLGCLAVVITHGGDGVYGKVGEKYFDYHSPYSSNCESVIGAGDCFIAMLGLAMAHALDIVDAVKIAYEAGAVYVGKKYNEPITFYEIMRRLDPIGGKEVGAKYLADVAKKEKLIFTNGVFDAGLTANHIDYLQKAKSYGDKLVVALNSDESTRRLKGDNRPILSLEERMKIVAGLQSVDYVTGFEEDTPLELIKKIMPAAVVKGGDGYIRENVVGYGIVDVIITDKFEGMSTTEKLKKLNIDT